MDKPNSGPVVYFLKIFHMIVGHVSIVLLYHDSFGPYRLMYFPTLIHFYLAVSSLLAQNQKVNSLKMLPLYHVPEGVFLCVCDCVFVGVYFYDCVCSLMCAVDASSFKQLQY